MMMLKEIEGLPDYSEIIDLINAEWPREFGEKTDSEKIADMIDSHNTDKDRVKYLFDGDVIAGFYRYSLWPRDARITETAHIYDIAVLPSKQKQGLGTFMMDDLIEDCRRRKLDRLLSRSFRNNEASIRLHKRFGFHVHLETEDSIVWELIIRKAD